MKRHITKNQRNSRVSQVFALHSYYQIIGFKIYLMSSTTMVVFIWGRTQFDYLILGTHSSRVLVDVHHIYQTSPSIYFNFLFVCKFLIKISLFIWKLELHRKRERVNFAFAGSFSKGPAAQAWAGPGGPKAGGNSFPSPWDVPHGWQGASCLGHLLLLSQAASNEPDGKCSSQEKPAPRWNVGSLPFTP